VKTLLEDTPECAPEIADETEPTLSGGSTQGLIQKCARVLRSEVAGLRPRLMLAQLALAPFPIHVGGRLRSMILRLIGFQIDRGTMLADMPTITGDGNIYKKLVIGSCCWINIGCLFNLGGEIRVGNHVSIGHDVLVLTVSHEIGAAQHRASKLIVKPVSIGDGVWIGSRSTILPGVTIGSGAVIAAGSVVYHDVAPNTLVAGVPSRPIKKLR
jgi:maltose O-acetyltransferase